MANFNGLDMGIVEEWTTSAEPRELQINAYNGLDGLEVTDLGSRGGVTMLRGAILGNDDQDLAGIVRSWTAMQRQAQTGTFVDPTNYAWDNVLLRKFKTDGPRMRLAGDDGVIQRYEIEIMHLD